LGKKRHISLLGVSLQTDKTVLHEEVANIINTRILCVSYAKVRKVPTTTGATGSLSR
jgi:hypothetical protein